MTSRLKKASYTTILGLGLFAGAAGIAAASSGGGARTPSNETPGDSGVNCEDGIDAATGLECDGGPAVAQADEATEAPSAEGSDAVDTDAVQDETDGVDDATEVEGSDEADGIDHQNEGEETGNNGDGVADAGDATEAP